MEFGTLIKALKENFTASIAAVMVFAIFGLSGYVVQLHTEIASVSNRRFDYQTDCFEQVMRCEQYWRAKIDSIQRVELEKTQRQVNDLNDILKSIKR
jgi:hypothetical protein